MTVAPSTSGGSKGPLATVVNKRGSAVGHIKSALGGKSPPRRHMLTLLMTIAGAALILGIVVGMLIEVFLDTNGVGLEHWLMDPDGTCDDGLMVPGPSRTRLSAIVFTLLLLWSFVGVAIAADIFMVAIEFITSVEKITEVEVNGEKRQFHVTVWNSTVANLTLMALGSSAPEILLSVIEIMTSGFYAGELGPSTIVGSAAFNLLVISAVCIYAVGPEGKIIADRGVFYITASFSIFAYMWLIVILNVFTPNIIEPWEGVLTFVFFPILVGLAYLADTGKLTKLCSFGHPSDVRRATLIGFQEAKARPSEMSKEEVAKLLANTGVAELNTATKMAAKEAIASQLSSGTHSRAFYRVAATRVYTGGTDYVENEQRGTMPRKTGDVEAPPPQKPLGKGAAADDVVIQFSYPGASVGEEEPYVDLPVEVVGGYVTQLVSVQFDTVSGTATAGEDFVAVSGRIEFWPGSPLQVIRVPIKEDDIVEGDEVFSVILSSPSRGARLGAAAECEVTIQDNDSYGVLAFQRDSVPVKESEGAAYVTVVRKGGVAGQVSCKYHTVDETALVDSDYTATSGTLVFPPGVTQMQIKVPILDDGAYEKEETFRVELTDPEGGATFEDFTDGGAEKSICTVRILSDDVRRELVDLVTAELDINVDSLRLGVSSWREQLGAAVAFEGESFFSAAGLGYLLALPWKLICALIPPARIANGKFCFFCTLSVIGLLTALIGDLAAHVGCTLGLTPAVTAITFVALGTSLPDTFASKAAAVNEPSADNSIGNITGSNSVNVFLGLGLPWAVAAIYWSRNASDPAFELAWRQRYASEPWYTPDMPVGFAVPAGALGKSVGVFTVCAFVCLGGLIGRRAVLGHELGGADMPKKASAAICVSLWFLYIYLSA